jgi:hypothetical protein
MCHHHSLMVLCPFVFLYTPPVAPMFKLQPTEVASAHWVPIRTLLSPAFRTVETCDVSDRLARRFSGACEPIVRHTIRANLGQMQFAAVRLCPSVSVFSTFAGDYLAAASSSSSPPPLLLWGLTLGIVTDFLEMLPQGEAAAGWQYPTFTSWDLKAVLWLATRDLRKRNWEAARSGSVARALREHQEDSQSGSMVLIRENCDNSKPTSTVGTLLDGYYDAVRTAVWITLCGRAVVLASAAAGFVMWKRARR